MTSAHYFPRRAGRVEQVHRLTGEGLSKVITTLHDGRIGQGNVAQQHTLSM
jgi:hypothetical protein